MSGETDRSGQLPAVKRAIVELRKMRSRLAEAERARTEPIAIVGMALRFPGGAVDPDSFWRLLDEGRDAIVEVPADRWDREAYVDAGADAPGKMTTRHGGFLGDVDRFDPGFFGIAPREAVSMDPQHRLLLEVAWEALEHAGLSPSSLAGSETGVYLGLSNSDYNRLLGADPSAIDAYFSLGTTSSVAAGRLSYLLGLHGPSMAIDTACSSSLVAVHLACQSLRLRECDAALAGGVNLILAPDLNINFSKARMLAPDGHCKTFDAAADGYVRGEGCGIVVLKRLSDALKDGDRIAAIVRGSAVNQDGRSSGLTAPNGPAQEAVIRRALAAAGVSANDIQYVEAHGTGTPLGDPIEVNALANVLCKGRPDSSPLLVGSVKTNIGHLEAAAGVAGLIKVALSMERQRIPRHLNLTVLNPHVAWNEMALRVVSEPLAWPAGARARLAGVSSFGFSGTNAHLVIEESPAPVVEPNAVDRPKHILALSARTRPALQALAERYAVHLRADPGASAPDVCFTANAGRAHHEHRVAMAGESVSDLCERLDDVVRGRDHDRAVIRGETADGQSPRIVFMFPGQGSQFFAMGRELYGTQPAFTRVIDECDALLGGHLDRRLVSILFEAGDRDAINETCYTQPALFAIEYALARLWQSWGVQPSAVLGHSLGEDVAACIAGVFSLADGLRLMAIRGRLMQSLVRKGAMAAVFAPETKVRAAIAGANDVAVAAVNGPEHIVISGPAETVEQLVHAFEAGGVKARRLSSPCACHSPLMDPILAELERAVADVQYSRPTIPFVSNVTGAMVEDDEISTPAYWCRHVRECVRFHDGIGQLRDRGHSVFLEVGPGSTLVALGRRCWPGEDHVWLSSLKEGKGDWTEMVASLSSLYARGVDIDWAAFDAEYRRKRVALPTYPFERERYWMERRAPRAAVDRGERVYDVRWTRQALTPARAAGGTWVIVAEQPPAGTPLARELERRGGRVLLVLPREAALKVPGALPLDGSAVADVERVWDNVPSADVRGVVFIAGGGQPPPAPPVSLENDARERCCRLVSLTATVMRAPAAARLWVVTCGAESVDDQAPGTDLTQAALWGLGRVIGQEHAQHWGGLIDLGSAASFAEPSVLADELLGSNGEDQIAFRGGERFVARLLREQSVGESTITCDPGAAYLITGGLGSLGLRVARWLGDRGARHLVLVGRRGLPEPNAGPVGRTSPSRTDAVRRLEADGVSVSIVQADVADHGAVAAIVERLGAAGTPLRGVFHAAGVATSALVGELDAAAIHATMRGKVEGAWTLHRVTADLGLDWFVLFSSASAIWGGKGLGAYAAANHVLDALAHYRHSIGLPALSVNWGPWSGGGMTSDETRSSLEQIGVRAISPDAALRSLERLLGSRRVQATVADVDWRVFSDVYSAKVRRHLLDELARATVGEVSAGGDEAAGDEPLIAQLSFCPPENRRDVMAAHVQQAVAIALGVDPPSRVGLDRGFFDLGMDSLMAVDLRRRLEASVGRPLPPTLAFDYPSVDVLADWLLGLLFPVERGRTSEAGTPRPAGGTDLLADLESLSDEEIDALFAQKVAGQDRP